MPGRGWSSPVVAGGRVWLTTAVNEKGASLRALAFDVAGGREAVNVEVFRLRSAELTNPKNSHASPTPIVDGDRVYVHFGAEGTAALTTAGEIVWKARFPYESQHGNGGSPVLYGDLLIFSCDGSDEAFVVALDKRTGKVRWKTSRRQPWDQAYSTPLVIRVGDRDELVSVGAYRAAAYDPQTGKEIWRVELRRRILQRAASGVRARPGLHRDRLSAAVAAGRAAGRHGRRHEDPHRLDAEARRAADAVAAPRRRRALHRQRQRASRPASTRRPERRTGSSGSAATFSASPVFADGRIYFLSEEGTSTVIAPGKEFRKLATNTLDGEMLASMAVSERSIFIRTNSHLYRLAQQ